MQREISERCFRGAKFCSNIYRGNNVLEKDCGGGGGAGQVKKSCESRRWCSISNHKEVMSEQVKQKENVSLNGWRQNKKEKSIRRLTGRGWS